MCRHYFKYRNQINKYRDLTLIWAHYQGRKCESQHSLYYSYYYSIEIYNMLIFVDHQFCPIAMCVSSPPPIIFIYHLSGMQFLSLHYGFSCPSKQFHSHYCKSRAKLCIFPKSCLKEVYCYAFKRSACKYQPFHMLYIMY